MLNHRRYLLTPLVVAAGMALGAAAMAHADKPADKAQPAKAAPAKNPQPKPGIDNQQADQILEVLQNFNPGMADRLRALRKQDAEKFNEACGKVGQRIMHLVRLKKSDPKGFELAMDEQRIQRELDDLLQRCGSDAAALSDNRTQLRNLLDQQHATRLRGQEHELAQLERHVQDIRRKISDQSQRKDALTKERFKELTTGKMAARPELPAGDGEPEEPGPWFDPKTFDDKQLDQAVEVIRAARPDLADRLVQLRTKDVNAFRASLQQFGPSLRLLMNKRQQDPRGFELQLNEHRLDLASLELARKWREAKGDDRAKIEPQLNKSVQQHLDSRHHLLKHELSRVEKRIQRLRQELDDRRKNRDRLVDQRLQRLFDSATQAATTPAPAS